MAASGWASPDRVRVGRGQKPGHVPRGPVLAARTADRQEEGGGRRRPLHLVIAWHLLTDDADYGTSAASTSSSATPSGPRACDQPARGAWLPRHPRTRRLTASPTGYSPFSERGPRPSMHVRVVRESDHEELVQYPFPQERRAPRPGVCSNPRGTRSPRLGGQPDGVEDRVERGPVTFVAVRRPARPTSGRPGVTGVDDLVRPGQPLRGHVESIRD